MFSKRSAVVFLSVVTIVALAVLFSSCGGGGGAAGTAIDNSRANGDYKIIIMKGGSGGYGGGNVIGTFSFNGAGVATFNTSTFPYTVTTDNAITLDSTLIGNMRSGGTFFVVSDVTTTRTGIIVGIKQSDLATETTNTYMSGVFGHNGTNSSAGIVSVVTASPTTGQLTINNIAGSSPTGTIPYSLTLSNGTFTVSDAIGAISSDKEMMIMGDVITPDVMGLVGLKLPGSGMTAASVNGSYIMHEYKDPNVSGNGPIIVSRGRMIMSGGTGSTGTATFTELATSGTPTTVSQTFGYTMASDGTFTIQYPGYKGAALADGSVITLVDYDPAGDNQVSLIIGVKQ